MKNRKKHKTYICKICYKKVRIKDTTKHMAGRCHQANMYKMFYEEVIEEISLLEKRNEMLQKQFYILETKFERIYKIYKRELQLLEDLVERRGYIIYYVL